MATHSAVQGRSLNQFFGYGFGAVYLLIGLVGFAVTPGVGFAATHGKDLIIFGLNPLHNLVHIAVGVLLLAGAAAGAVAARTVNLTVGVVYLVVAILGLFVIGTSFNLLAINAPDNVLHFVTAIAALAVGLFGARQRLGRATA